MKRGSPICMPAARRRRRRPERARRLHKERKQLLPRERIAALIDPGSPFLEFCQLAGEGMYHGVPPGGSIITRVGVMVSGRACMIIANDATVKGGTYYGIKQEARSCPTVRMAAPAALCHAGAIRRRQPARISPISFSTRASSVRSLQPDPDVERRHSADRRSFTDRRPRAAPICALCDETVIVRNQGAMFLAAQLVYAATKEEVGIEALGGGETHSRVSGVTDHLAESDSHAIAITRDIVAHLGEIPAQRWAVTPPRPPVRIPTKSQVVSATRACRPTTAISSRASSRRQRVSRVQAPVWRYAGHRLCAHHGI